MRWILFPFSVIFAVVAYIRNRLFDYKILKSKEFDIPIIAIGNITVGGTGKTPHIEYLVSLLKNQFKVATLSRGYKRKTKGFLLANNQSTVNDIGDEPKQIKQKFPEIEVAVDEKRVHGVEKLLELHNSLNVVLLDDAFQHRYIKPGLTILLIDYNQPIDKDFYLPSGRLRESINEKSRANIIIFTKTPADIKPIDRRIMVTNLNPFPYQSIYFTTFKYGNLKPVFAKNNIKISLEIIKNEGYEVLLVTGIAKPALLHDYISEYTKQIKHLSFPDHYEYKTDDLTQIQNSFENIKTVKKIILTTEKDAVRLSELEFKDKNMKNNFFYIPIEVCFLYDENEEFNKQIIQYVRKD